jgi:ATP-binding cassette subfamily B protein
LVRRHDIHSSTAGPRRHGETLHRFLPYLWPKTRPDLRLRIALALVLLLAAKLVGVATPLFFGWAIDALSPGRVLHMAGWTLQVPEAGPTLALILGLVFAYVAGRVFSVALAQFRDHVSAPVGQHAQREIARQTFEHLHRLSLRFHLERRTGGLSRVIDRGTKAIDSLIRFTLFSIGPTLIELAALAILFWGLFGAAFPVIVLLTVGAYVWFTFAVTEWRNNIRREMNDRDTDANTKAIDSLLNYETVKYFGNERHETARFDRALAGYEHAATRTAQTLATMNTGQTVIFNLGLGALLAVGAHDVLAGTMTIGAFGAINIWILQLFQPLNLLGMVYRELVQALVDMETMFGLLTVEPEIRDAPDAKPLAVTGGEIRFEHVAFAYEPDRTILGDVSFVVPAGRKVAMVGASGAGKSTISRILYRFYDIAGGRVTIDGQDIRSVTQDSLRAAIGMVPQDTVLFNDTIRYNIRYGRPGASDEEVETAARAAQIHGFVATLPKGYDTMVGERGLKLSGGEKQRVAIARTLLKGPPILILDEATSALDTHTEKDIVAALGQITRNHTTLVVAHRLSTIVDADEILVLDAGRIAERGTHEALLLKDGLYAAMWNRQQEAAAVRERLAVVEAEAEQEAAE